MSTKTILGVEVDCVNEARQILQASRTDSVLRYAVESLRVLRKDIETCGDDPNQGAQQSIEYKYGLQQYGKALGGMMSNLIGQGIRGDA